MSPHGSRYPPELRKRAGRMVAQINSDYPSEWAAIAAAMSQVGIG
jgi:transposase